MNSTLKLTAIAEFPVPRDSHDVRRFLNLALYFRRSLPGFTDLSKVLHNLLNKQSPFEWTAEHQRAFENLRSELLKRPASIPFDPKHETELHTDASSRGLAGMLLQCPSAGQQCLVDAVSRRTSNLEKNYHSSKLEFTALSWTISKFHSLLKNVHFKVVTDCQALLCLNQSSSVYRRREPTEWAWILADYDMEIEHRAAKKLAHVDALSRAPTDPPETDDTFMKYCEAIFPTECLSDKFNESHDEEILKRNFKEYELLEAIFYELGDETELRSMKKNYFPNETKKPDVCQGFQ